MQPINRPQQTQQCKKTQYLSNKFNNWLNITSAFNIHGSTHLGNKGFIETPTRCILFIYFSALHVSGYAHLQELQMYFANHRCVYSVEDRIECGAM